MKSDRRSRRSRSKDAKEKATEHQTRRQKRKVEEEHKTEQKSPEETNVPEKEGSKDDSVEWFARKRKEIDPLTTKAGGAYIPPAKLKLMQQQIADKGSEQYQRLEWERLKKKIHGHVNKINVGNLVSIVRELLQENIVRGKGLLCRSIIQAQAFSPTFSHVYAGLVSVINSKFPHIGELVLKRLIIQFKRSFRRNDKQTAITVTKFLAHLINQQVAHEVLALEILTLLLETPTDDSVEVAVAFLRESGAKLTEVTPRGINAIFDRLRSILQESKDVDKRVQYMIEVIFSVRKDKFSAHPSVTNELDLVEEDDQITHTITLDEAQDPENMLNVFQFDHNFEINEEMYGEIRKEMLGENSDDEESGEESEVDEEEDAQKPGNIVDNTETNLVAFRRLVYLTIQSSLDYQEAAHKLLKIEIKPGMEVELCNMILDCCAQQRTYEKFYGLLAERFARLRKEFQENFEQIFKDTYETIHRFEITKLRNTTKLFAHLLFTDAISWDVLSIIKLNEDDSTSSGRIFVKILFQELTEYLGLEKLYERIRDGTLQVAFEGIFPRDNPRDTRFSINFFTSIGLGGLTVDLREHLQSGPKQIVSLPEMPVGNKMKEEISTSSESSGSTDSSSTSSSSESEESEAEGRKLKRHRKEISTKERKAKERDLRRQKENCPKNHENRSRHRSKEKYRRR